MKSRCFEGVQIEETFITVFSSFRLACTLWRPSLGSNTLRIIAWPGWYISKYVEKLTFSCILKVGQRGFFRE